MEVLNLKNIFRWQSDQTWIQGIVVGSVHGTNIDDHTAEWDKVAHNSEKRSRFKEKIVHEECDADRFRVETFRVEPESSDFYTVDKRKPFRCRSSDLPDDEKEKFYAAHKSSEDLNKPKVLDQEK